MSARVSSEVSSAADSTVYDELTRANRRATRFLLAGSVVIAAVMVWVVAGAIGMPVLDPGVGVTVTAVGVGLGLVFMFVAMRSGPSLALRAAKARPVSRQEAPQLHNVFDEVCAAAGIMGTKPKLYLVDDPAPNAFATGMKLEDSHVAVTTGLVQSLPRYELRAVLAHEVSHILNNDIKAVTVAVATAGLVALLADVLVRFMWFGGARSGGRGRGGGQGGGGAQAIFLVVGIIAVILAPIAARVIRFAVSRQREYLADATASKLLRDPQSMVNALRRIDGDTTDLHRFEVATAHLWFEEPNDTRAKSKQGKMARRFATHPSIGERIERLARLNAGTVRLDAPLPPVGAEDDERPDDGDGTGPDAGGDRRPPPPPPGPLGQLGIPPFGRRP